MLTIDFVSDVSCPWCAIGLHSLERALDQVGPEVQARIRFRPFELNPQAPAEGEDTVEHLQRKYGISAEQVRANAEAIRQRGEGVGFTFTPGQRKRVWNTRDAHRLLHWAAEQDEANGGDAQHRLKHALFKAYFTDGENPSDHALLQRLAIEAGLDRDGAAAVLADRRYDDAVAADEAHWYANGVSSVPTLIINSQYVITGGQPPETFAKALRHIAEQAENAGENGRSGD
jgi:predicted DsbA family dithiol-disulfide isomerase